MGYYKQLHNPYASTLEALAQAEVVERSEEEITNQILEMQQERDENQKTWFKWYDQYLASPEWQKKRDKVLKRDKYLCQGCLTNRATQVHHLTYERAGNEMMFDLISICTQCHDLVHQNRLDILGGTGV